MEIIPFYNLTVKSENLNEAVGMEWNRKGRKNVAGI